jgi:hypothetical protein
MQPLKIEPLSEIWTNDLAHQAYPFHAGFPVMQSDLQCALPQCLLMGHHAVVSSCRSRASANSWTGNIAADAGGEPENHWDSGLSFPYNFWMDETQLRFLGSSRSGWCKLGTLTLSKN